MTDVKKLWMRFFFYGILYQVFIIKMKWREKINCTHLTSVPYIIIMINEIFIHVKFHSSIKIFFNYLQIITPIQCHQFT